VRPPASPHVINVTFINPGQYGNAGGNNPAGTTWRYEMTTTHLALMLKILAILELIIKAIVIYLTR
jgi:hypothetical protein